MKICLTEIRCLFLKKSTIQQFRKSTIVCILWWHIYVSSRRIFSCISLDDVYKWFCEHKSENRTVYTVDATIFIVPQWVGILKTCQNIWAHVKNTYNESNVPYQLLILKYAFDLNFRLTYKKQHICPTFREDPVIFSFYSYK